MVYLNDILLIFIEKIPNPFEIGLGRTPEWNIESFQRIFSQIFFLDEFEESFR